MRFRGGLLIWECYFMKQTATLLFLVFTFLLFISFASKALRHKEARRFFYFRIDNFPFRVIEGAATSLFLIFTLLLSSSLATKALRQKEPRRLFHFQVDNFPFRGIEGAWGPCEVYYSWDNDNFISEKPLLHFTPRFRGWLFDILHFTFFSPPRRQKVTKNHQSFFISDMKNFLLWGLGGFKLNKIKTFS